MWRGSPVRRVRRGRLPRGGRPGLGWPTFPDQEASPAAEPSSTRLVVTAVVAVAVVAVLVLSLARIGGSVPAAHAQPTTSDAASASAASSDGLFGLWPRPSSEVPAAADVLAIVPLAGSTDELVRVGVRFAQPFDQPGDGYRVSVLVGDPSTGGDLRVSYRVVGGLPVGVVDAMTDGEWIDVQPGVVVGSPTEGLLEFDIPRGLLPGAGDPTAPLPSTIWVETDVPVLGGTRFAVSNYFAFAAFLPDALEVHPTTPAGLDPVIGASGWGAVEAYATSKPFPLQPALKAPSLSLANKGLMITTELPAPTAVDGQQAISVLDRVRLLQADLSAPSPGYISIDRLTGSIELVGADGQFISGDSSWVSEGPDPADAGAAGTIVVDLAAVATLLGLPSDPAELAVSADRTIELADARTIVLTGTGAVASVVSEVAADPPASGGEGSSGDGTTKTADDDSSFVLIAAVIAAAVVVIAVVAVVVVLRRRRRDDPENDPVWDAERDRSPREPRTGGSSPDEVIAALERQFSELGLPEQRAADPDDRDQPSRS